MYAKKVKPTRFKMWSVILNVMFQLKQFECQMKNKMLELNGVNLTVKSDDFWESIASI